MSDEEIAEPDTASTTKNEPKSVIRYDKEFVSLQCEWGECDKVFQILDEYISHVASHLDSLTGDEFHCSWVNCGFGRGFHCNNVPEFRLHVQYHAFHTKIKCFGLNLILRQKLSCCVLGSLGRNLVPHLPQSLQCYWYRCNREFDNPVLYFQHVDSHCEACETKNGVDCLWDGCDGHFQSKHKLRDHMRTHTQEKLVACPTCGGLFANRTKFYDHIKRQTPIDEQNYQCSHCRKRLPSERLLKDHMRHHVNHYRCPFCDMTCPSPSSLDTHIRYRHSEAKAFSCEMCSYSCKSETDLRKHLRSHSTQSTCKCHHPNCKYEARSESSLSAHAKKAHMGEASRYICHVCEKKFTRGTYLTSHLFKEHNYRWPSGHSRFRYQRDSDGFFRLQTIRYESIELTQEMCVDLSSKSKPEKTVVTDRKANDQSPL